MTTQGNRITITDKHGTENAVFVNGTSYKGSDFGTTLGAGFQFKLSDKISLPLMLNYLVSGHRGEYF